jgi:hypothetical protein
VDGLITTYSGAKVLLPPHPGVDYPTSDPPGSGGGSSSGGGSGSSG